LHWVAQYANVEIIKVLIASQKTELNKLEENGYTPLYYARERSKWFAKTPEDTKIAVTMLEQAGAKELAMNPVRIWHEIKSNYLGMFASH
jgi:ankyrin repeat protein